ncbi:FkbM family methyltransferase [Paenibacillus hamazuiensis]|uniref:FkbM family methyltransferase n=1 Tax=Paenibacillus hamazuiensis TaxID=2936508 RepID=UPI00200D44B9|nr:FkbM family methyltransferase [Paenibacillus hamazuiensis]
MTGESAAYQWGEEFLVLAHNSFGQMLKMFISGPGIVEDYIMKTGRWEPHLADLMSRFSKEGGVVLDVGAYIGYHTLNLASLSPGITCICFEPHPAIYGTLTRNVAANSLSNVQAYNYAVGDSQGTVSFYMQSKDNYNRALSTIHYHHEIGSFEETKVTSITLNDFLNEDIKSRVNVLKIDTQGNEYQVLKGASDILHKSRPLIAFEYHPHCGVVLEDIVNLMPGYDIYKMDALNGELRKLHEPDPNNFALDYVCIPRSL